MAVEIVDGEVLEVSQVDTGEQIATVKVGKGWEKNIVLTVDRPIKNDGVDKAVITAQVKDYQGNNVAESVQVVFALNGEDFPVLTIGAGAASIDFTSLTSGVFGVNCSRERYGAGYVEVVVNEA